MSKFVSSSYTFVRRVVQFQYNNIIRSIYVTPTYEGNIAIIQSLTLIGIVTISCIQCNLTKNILIIPSSYPLKHLILQEYAEGNDNDMNNMKRCKDISFNNNKKSDTNIIIDIQDSTNSSSMMSIIHQIQYIGTTFVRVLFIPSCIEEIIWRVVPTSLSSTSSIYHILLWNTLYTASHIVHANVLQLLLLYNPSITTTTIITNKTMYRSTIPNNQTILVATRQVFTNPTFLFIAFCLGNVCTYTYIRSGYALYAPVLVHSITVTIWLTYFQGNTILGR